MKLNKKKIELDKMQQGVIGVFMGLSLVFIIIAIIYLFKVLGQ